MTLALALLLSAHGLPHAISGPPAHTNHLLPTKLAASASADSVSAEGTEADDPFNEANMNKDNGVVISNTTKVVFPHHASRIKAVNTIPTRAMPMGAKSEAPIGAVMADADQIGVGAPAPWPIHTTGDVKMAATAAVPNIHAEMGGRAAEERTAARAASDQAAAAWHDAAMSAWMEKKAYEEKMMASQHAATAKAAAEKVFADKAMAFKKVAAAGKRKARTGFENHFAKMKTTTSKLSAKGVPTSPA